MADGTGDKVKGDLRQAGGGTLYAPADSSWA